MNAHDKYPKMSIIEERSGKFCMKRLTSFLFTITAVILSILYITLDISGEVAEHVPGIIVTFAMISGGVQALTIPKFEK